MTGTLRTAPLPIHNNGHILRWLIDWMVFYTAFNSISAISWWQLTLFMPFLGFTSTTLGSEVSCPRTLTRKNPKDPVWLEPRTYGWRVKHFTTEPCGTHILRWYEWDLLVFCKFNKHRSRRPLLGLYKSGLCGKDSLPKDNFWQIFLKPFFPGLLQLTLYHTNLTFKDPEKNWLLETLWENEKILVNSIFSSFNQFFYEKKKKNPEKQTFF